MDPGLRRDDGLDINPTARYLCIVVLVEPTTNVFVHCTLRDEAFIKIPISLAFLSVLFAATLVT